jgi:hypothetical protein
VSDGLRLLVVGLNEYTEHLLLPSFVGGVLQSASHHHIIPVQTRCHYFCVCKVSLGVERGHRICTCTSTTCTCQSHVLLPWGTSTVVRIPYSEYSSTTAAPTTYRHIITNVLRVHGVLVPIFRTCTMRYKHTFTLESLFANNNHEQLALVYFSIYLECKSIK